MATNITEIISHSVPSSAITGQVINVSALVKNKWPQPRYLWLDCDGFNNMFDRSLDPVPYSGMVTLTFGNITMPARDITITIYTSSTPTWDFVNNVDGDYKTITVVNTASPIQPKAQFIENLTVASSEQGDSYRVRLKIRNVGGAVGQFGLRIGAGGTQNPITLNVNQEGIIESYDYAMPNENVAHTVEIMHKDTVSGVWLCDESVYVTIALGTSGYPYSTIVDYQFNIPQGTGIGDPIQLGVLLRNTGNSSGYLMFKANNVPSAWTASLPPTSNPNPLIGSELEGVTIPCPAPDGSNRIFVYIETRSRREYDGIETIGETRQVEVPREQVVIADIYIADMRPDSGQVDIGDSITVEVDVENPSLVTAKAFVELIEVVGFGPDGVGGTIDWSKWSNTPITDGMKITSGIVNVPVGSISGTFPPIITPGKVTIILPVFTVEKEIIYFKVVLQQSFGGGNSQYEAVSYQHLFIEGYEPYTPPGPAKGFSIVSLFSQITAEGEFVELPIEDMPIEIQASGDRYFLKATLRNDKDENKIVNIKWNLRDPDNNVIDARDAQYVAVPKGGVVSIESRKQWGDTGFTFEKNGIHDWWIQVIDEDPTNSGQLYINEHIDAFNVVGGGNNGGLDLGGMMGMMMMIMMMGMMSKSMGGEDKGSENNTNNNDNDDGLFGLF